MVPVILKLNCFVLIEFDFAISVKIGHRKTPILLACPTGVKIAKCVPQPQNVRLFLCILRLQLERIAFKYV